MVSWLPLSAIPSTSFLSRTFSPRGYRVRCLQDVHWLSCWTRRDSCWSPSSSLELHSRLSVPTLTHSLNHLHGMFSIFLKTGCRSPLSPRRSEKIPSICLLGSTAVSPPEPSLCDSTNPSPRSSLSRQPQQTFSVLLLQLFIDDILILEACFSWTTAPSLLLIPPSPKSKPLSKADFAESSLGQDKSGSPSTFANASCHLLSAPGEHHSDSFIKKFW